MPLARGRKRTGASAVRWGFGALALVVLLSGWIGAAAAFARDAAQIVRYHRYRVVVPRSWPVFDLASDPSVCVRFNRHAVYLGRPSAEQRCPAHTVGRTEAILIEPAGGVASGARAASAAAPPPSAPPFALPAVTTAGGQPAGGSAARLGVPRDGVVVTATWGGDPRVVERALGWFPLLKPKLPPPTPAPPARAAGAPATPGGVYTGLGFDACSAPSPAAMSAWSSSPYRALGIYVGGANMACSQPNLTATWAGVQSAAGWHLIPTYVGLQAPHNSCACPSIQPNHASAEGVAAATDAVTRVQALDIGAGSPIFFDMEAYPQGGSNTSAVLAFLSAWTSTLHDDGYLSGVYSSTGSGITDLVNAVGAGFVEPDELWIADWNGLATTSDASVPAGDWPGHARVHQYQGGHNATYGGVTINIDSNYLDAPTAAGTDLFPDGTFAQIPGTPAAYRVAGGSPLYVNDPAALGAIPPYTPITQQQFASLSPTPADGTFLTTTTGGSYRIAGGAPLYISDWTRFGGVQPSVTIDEWDIDNITNPLAHLRLVPRNGTFLTTTAGGIYRVAGGTALPIRSWSLFGGVQSSVRVDQWNINHTSSPLAHLSPRPADGTLVEGLPSDTYWLFKGGRRAPTGAGAGAVAVDDTGLAAFPKIAPPPRCIVPPLGRLTLPAVKRTLRRTRCLLGAVRRLPHPPSRRVLHVIRQSPRARATRAAGWAVSVTLG